MEFSGSPRVEGEASWKVMKGLFGGCGNIGEGIGGQLYLG